MRTTSEEQNSNIVAAINVFNATTLDITKTFRHMVPKVYDNAIEQINSAYTNRQAAFKNEGQPVPDAYTQSYTQTTEAIKTLEFLG